MIYSGGGHRTCFDFSSCGVKTVLVRGIPPASIHAAPGTNGITFGRDGIAWPAVELSEIPGAVPACLVTGADNVRLGTGGKAYCNQKY